MGTTPSFNLVYEKIENGQKIVRGIKTAPDGTFYEGITHPSQIEGKPKKVKAKEDKPKPKSIGKLKRKRK